jgi:hypothetical protein
MNHPFPVMMDGREIQYTLFAPFGNGEVPENATPGSREK